MTDQMPIFGAIEAEAPDFEVLSEAFSEMETRLAEATDPTQAVGAVKQWDELSRSLETWRALVEVYFHQDTQNAESKANKTLADELWPKIIGLHDSLKRTLLEHRLRPQLQAVFGPQAFDLWQMDNRSFAPEIESMLVEESTLVNRYVELTGTAQIAFDGQQLNLSEIVRYLSSSDRTVRHGAEQARWGWFSKNGEELDSIFDQLVEVRNRTASTLGLASFTELGYLRMQRIDYSQADVARFRDQIRDWLVPLCQQIRDKQATDLGLDRVLFWDEPVLDRLENPKPKGDPAWIVEQAREMFGQIHPELGSFFCMLADNGFLDLQAREGKAPGGFCTAFPSEGVPFIFSNFNGTLHDIDVLVHEMGHAFQYWNSRDQPLFDYLWPTMESAEITSMGLELLSYPHAEHFFGEDAARYRWQHLARYLLFMPYGVAVDEFQHLVYANPQASSAERKEIWRALEQTYLPDRDYGDLAYPAAGGMWQVQRHIYAVPFYYIDYVLAVTAALQLWARAATDREQALQDYLAVCRAGGTLPFQKLMAHANIASPFEDGSLLDVVDVASQSLGFRR